MDSLSKVKNGNIGRNLQGETAGQRDAARIDSQREQLAGRLGELEATERVPARYTRGPRARNMASVRTPLTAINAAAPARSGGRLRITAAKSANGKRSSPSLSDQVLAL